MTTHTLPSFSLSLTTFIAADCGDRVAAHSVRMNMITHHVTAAIKGNATQLVAAAKEVSARKEKVAKAYAAAFQAAGLPARAHYDGRCTEAIMQSVILPRVTEYVAAWEQAFLQVMPVEPVEKTEAEKAAAKKARAEKKDAAAVERATELGYVKADELTSDNALPIIKNALPVLEQSQLSELQVFIDALIAEKQAAAATAAASANSKKQRKAKAKAKAEAEAEALAA